MVSKGAAQVLAGQTGDLTLALLVLARLAMGAATETEFLASKSWAVVADGSAYNANFFQNNTEQGTIASQRNSRTC